MKKSLIILFLILAFAIVLRVYKVSSHPPYGDELTILQDAYSITHTGKDVTGKAFPLTFSMGAGRPGGYVYATIPFMLLFGENALGVRALSVVSGIGIILLIFMIVKRLFSEKAALIAAGLTSIAPWALNLSRGGFEASFALLLALGGIYFFLKGEKKALNYVWASVFWGLTILTYPTYKLVLPPVIILLVCLFGRSIFAHKVKLFLISAVIIGLFFSGLSIRESVLSGSEARFLSINVFAQHDLREKIIQKINHDRTISSLPQVAPLFHNKAVEYAGLLKNSYLSNLSAEYLFLSGDGNPRHNMTQTGVLLWIEMALIILGFTYLVKNNFYKEVGLLLGWILVSPLATTLIAIPHTLRNAFMFPPLTILSALGIIFLMGIKNKMTKTFLLLLVGAVGLIQLAFILERLYFISPNAFSRAWSAPAKKAAEFALREKNNYDYILLSDKIDSIEYAYPVYAKVGAEEVISQNQNKTSLGGSPFKKFDNVYIGTVSREILLSTDISLKGSLLFIGNLNYDGSFALSDEIISYDDPTQSLVIVRK